jgi:hypothetical protein
MGDEEESRIVNWSLSVLNEDIGLVVMVTREDRHEVAKTDLRWTNMGARGWGTIKLLAKGEWYGSNP